MIHLDIFKSREEWLEKRADRIGGSDAACILGKNPWRSNVDLFREKVGAVKPQDISNEAAVMYGTKAEPLLRELFKLDHPELNICYAENNMFTADEYPFAHASLDGWWDDGMEICGILEIKTATINNARQMREWDGRIPMHYYCQVLWYMMVTGARTAWVKALLKQNKANGLEETIRQYKIDRVPQVEQEIRILANEGQRFYEAIQNRKEPALILPDI